MPRLSSDDLAACHALLARGSKSFAFAGRLLPARTLDPVAALYAFCRVSDDLVDESAAPREALAALARRLDDVYAGRPADDPVDRALAWLVEEHGLPRAPLDALLDGYAWDVEARPLPTLSDVIAYAARVAASVGVAMTWLIDAELRRAPIASQRAVLARACDLGVAMQLTNIARDVGEDARRGRLYLPRTWLPSLASDDALATWLATPRPSPEVRTATSRLLDHADVLYARSESGLAVLPREVRPAIRVARVLYAEIGEEVRRASADAITSRAHTSLATKVRMTGRALRSEAWLGLARRAGLAGPLGLDDAPLPEVELLLPPEGPPTEARPPTEAQAERSTNG